MIKLEIPDNRPDILIAFSKALAEIAKGAVASEALLVSEIQDIEEANPNIGPKEIPTVDETGKPFDERYFIPKVYGRGNRKGQWQKKRGVSDEQYDALYQKTTPTPIADDSSGTVSAPQGLGNYATWLSEQQANGSITSQDLEAVSQETGVTMQNLLALSNDPEQLQVHIDSLYTAFSERIKNG